MEQLCESLTRAEIKVVEWGKRYHVAFDNSKNEIIAFIRQWKADLRKQLTEAEITVRGHTIRFNVEVSR